MLVVVDMTDEEPHAPTPLCTRRATCTNTTTTQNPQPPPPGGCLDDILVVDLHIGPYCLISLNT